MAHHHAKKTKHRMITHHHLRRPYHKGYVKFHQDNVASQMHFMNAQNAMQNKVAQMRMASLQGNPYLK